MSTIASNANRVTYSAVSMNNPDGAEQGQVNFEVRRVGSTCERIRTLISENRVGAALIIGGATLLATTALFGGAGAAGLFSFRNATAISGNASASTGSNVVAVTDTAISGNASIGSDAVAVTNATGAASSTGSYHTTSRPAKAVTTQTSIPTTRPTLFPPKTVNCSELNSFNFTIKKHERFELNLTVGGVENVLFSNGRPSYNTEYVVDPKMFCKNGTFAGEKFSFSDKPHRGDKTLSSSLTVEQLLEGTQTLDTGALAVKDGRISQYLECDSASKDNHLKCKDNAQKACEKVNNFKAIVPPSHKDRLSSVFITERKDNPHTFSQPADYRVFFTNYENKTVPLSVNVQADCESIIDAKLTFACNAAAGRNSLSDFTLRGLIDTDEAGLEMITSSACKFNKNATFDVSLKDCDLRFNGSSNCGGVLDALATRQDKMIVFVSADIPDADSHNKKFDLKAVKGTQTYLLEEGTALSSPRLTFLTGNSKYNKCHIVRRKVQKGYDLRAEFVIDGKNTTVETSNVNISKDYRSVSVKHNSITLGNETHILKGYEQPCDTTTLDIHQAWSNAGHSLSLKVTFGVLMLANGCLARSLCS